MSAVAGSAPPGLCMTAALRDRDDLVDFIRSATANLSIRYLICAGNERSKAPVCSSLLLLCRDDEPQNDPAGSLAKAVTMKLDAAQLAVFQRRVKSVDMRGCVDPKEIAERVAELGAGSRSSSTGFVVPQEGGAGVERLIVPLNMRYEGRPDKAGDFNIRLDRDSIVVEHMNQKDVVQREIVGKTARDICLTLIRNGWVSKLDHAAYLGRELARAEAALRRGEKFVSDSVEPGRAAPAPMPAP